MILYSRLVCVIDLNVSSAIQRSIVCWMKWSEKKISEEIYI